MIASPNSDVDDNYACELALGVSHFVLQDDMKAFISTTDLIIVKVYSSILLFELIKCDFVLIFSQKKKKNDFALIEIGCFTRINTAWHWVKL